MIMLSFMLRIIFKTIADISCMKLGKNYTLNIETKKIENIYIAKESLQIKNIKWIPQYNKK